MVAVLLFLERHRVRTRQSTSKAIVGRRRGLQVGGDGIKEAFQEGGSGLEGREGRTVKEGTGGDVD